MVHSKRQLGSLLSLISLLPAWLSLLSAPSVDAVLLSTAHDLHSESSRKSLGWGPDHSHRHYASASVHADQDRISFLGLRSSSPRQSSIDAIKLVNFATSQALDRSPKAVATRLAEHLLSQADSHGLKTKAIDFYVRPDSYTDPQSGISHFYIRQLVNGIEVADADLNVNIDSQGNILSFGSSLYTGRAPAPFTNPSKPSFAKGQRAKKTKVDGQARCQELRTKLESLLYPKVALEAEYEHEAARGGVYQIAFTSSGRRTRPKGPTGPVAEALPLQEELYELCSVPSDDPLLKYANLGSRHTGSLAAYTQTSGPEAILDPRLALLGFLEIATPDAQLAASLKDPSALEEAASQIYTTFEHKLLPGSNRPVQVEHLHNVPTAKGPVAAQLAYVQTEQGQLNLVWRFEVPLKDNAYEAYVDANELGSISTVVDWVHSMPRRHDQLPPLGRPDFSSYPIVIQNEKVAKPVEPLSEEPEEDSELPLYKVFRWGLNDPTEGRRTLEEGLHFQSASPLGWHTVAGKGSPFDSASADVNREIRGNNTFYKDTRGNNVYAQSDPTGSGEWHQGSIKRPAGKHSEEEGTSMLFDYPYPWRKAESKHNPLPPKTYVDAAVVQLFVTINEYHDLLYAYGFDEPSGNFQEHNFGRGGEGSDGVIAFAQDGAGTDNADFMTPPDGQRGRMRMYTWDQSTPFRDGDFEAGIVIHEYSHGLSTRLTGGPANSGCLGWGESGGMGEGWGDALASIIRRTGPKKQDWPMGSWASNREKGIRNYPYSTNMSHNPETYEYLDRGGYYGVHAIGEVWATILNEVEEKLTKQHGFTESLFPPAVNSTQAEKERFYRDESSLLPRVSKRPVPKHGNTLTVQLILDGMKLQPCRPGFFEARDAILEADHNLTGGENKCLLWKAFAKRGLGPKAKVWGRTPWGGGKRTNDFSVPKECKH
ncbi:hypothetical protein IE53DRAFT_229820 [Violaceomyces palustris]|uniref:Uncharacterized protein n=1 Tax=Violaceomyces palustris TaxID=1673888 RepID=A0ACD0NPP3_9BASI|nr:hypothetical protein IE53DRAFT_229820 [Violaceomyces palustris]